MLVDELIDGKRYPDQGVVIQALLIFAVLAIFSFYMEPFVDIYTFVGVISLVIYQFINFKNKKYQGVKEDAEDFSSIQIVRGYFEHFCMVLFLIFFKFIAKSGAFFHELGRTLVRYSSTKVSDGSITDGELITLCYRP